MSTKNWPQDVVLGKKIKIFILNLSLWDLIIVHRFQENEAFYRRWRMRWRLYHTGTLLHVGIDPMPVTTGGKRLSAEQEGRALKWFNVSLVSYTVGSGPRSWIWPACWRPWSLRGSEWVLWGCARPWLGWWYASPLPHRGRAPLRHQSRWCFGSWPHKNGGTGRSHGSGVLLPWSKVQWYNSIWGRNFFLPHNSCCKKPTSEQTFHPRSVSRKNIFHICLQPCNLLPSVEWYDLFTGRFYGPTIN